MGTLVELGRFLDQDRGTNAEAAPAGILVREPELADLRGFCVAARLGSIGAAARELQLSQPALSKRLRRLETVAGTALFERTSQGVTLTAAGAQLCTAVQGLLARADSVTELISGYRRQTREVRVASSPTVAESWLPRALADLAFTAERPSISLTTASSAQVRQMIQDGRCDVGLAAADPDGPRAAAEVPVWEDEVVVGVPLHHPWAGQAAIDPLEFASTPLVQHERGANCSELVRRALGDLGLAPAQPLAEIGSASVAVATAVALSAPVLLSATSIVAYAGSRLTIRRVRGLTFERQFAMLLAAAPHELAAPARAFARHILDWQARDDAAVVAQAS